MRDVLLTSVSDEPQRWQPLAGLFKRSDRDASSSTVLMMTSESDSDAQLSDDDGKLFDEVGIERDAISSLN